LTFCSNIVVYKQHKLEDGGEKMTLHERKRIVQFGGLSIPLQILSALSLRQRLNKQGFLFYPKDNPDVAIRIFIKALESNRTNPACDLITVEIRAEIDAPFGYVKEAEDFLDEVIEDEIKNSQNDAFNAVYLESSLCDEVEFVPVNPPGNCVVLPIWLGNQENDPDSGFLFPIGAKRNGSDWPTIEQTRTYGRLYIVDVDKTYQLYSLPELPTE